MSFLIIGRAELTMAEGFKFSSVACKSIKVTTAQQCSLTCMKSISCLPDDMAL